MATEAVAALTHGNDEWPIHAIPVSVDEMRMAAQSIRDRELWASAFTNAALIEALEPYFGTDWCIAALRKALLIQPDGSRYDYPAATVDEITTRWRVWPAPPVAGHELGAAFAAQFGRENDRTIRDEWAAKAIPQNPIHVIRATRWMRFMYGWSTYASLKYLAKLLTPFFKQGWCPEAVKWAIENHPKRGRFFDRAASFVELEKRLKAWIDAGLMGRPPIEGASWETIVENKRRRIVNESVRESGGERWATQQALRSERWKYKRSLTGMREHDERIANALQELDPRPLQLSGPDVLPEVDERVCSCGRYLCLPKLSVCTVCARRYR